MLRHFQRVMAHKTQQDENIPAAVYKVFVGQDVEQNKIGAQRSGSDLRRKKEPVDM